MFDGMQYVGGSFVGFGMGMAARHAWLERVGPEHDRLLGASARVLMLVLWNARPRPGASAH